MQPMVNIALRAARKAGEIIARAAERPDLVNIRQKENRSYVTEIDQAAEKEILYHLKKAYPDHSFICEEGGHSNGSNPDYTWIIDPLDGTNNFIHGLPHFAISIACQLKGQIEHAVIFDPIRQEEFTASRGRGAVLNGRRIRVSDRKNLTGAIVGTEFPSELSQNRSAVVFQAISETIRQKYISIRRSGSAALDLAYVAAGRLDACWALGLQKWDVAGGSLLIREAGGFIADLNGQQNYLDSGNIICGNTKCFKELQELIQQHME